MNHKKLKALDVSNRQELQKALDDVLRLKEDYNEGQNDITSSDVWVAQGHLADVVEKILKRPSLEQALLLMSEEIHMHTENYSTPEREEALKDGLAGLLFGFDVYEAADIAARAYYNFEEHFVKAFKEGCDRIHGPDNDSETKLSES